VLEGNKLRKILKSKKALSPVVAAIILIAVTVAVSIAVAAWMGSLTIGFMETSELTITDITFTDDGDEANPADVIELSVSNTGTSSVTISIVKVNGATMTEEELAGNEEPDFTFGAGLSGTITITTDWNAGTLVGSYTATA